MGARRSACACACACCPRRSRTAHLRQRVAKQHEERHADACVGQPATQTHGLRCPGGVGGSPASSARPRSLFAFFCSFAAFRFDDSFAAAVSLARSRSACRAGPRGCHRRAASAGRLHLRPRPRCRGQRRAPKCACVRARACAARRPWRVRRGARCRRAVPEGRGARAGRQGCWHRASSVSLARLLALCPPGQPACSLRRGAQRRPRRQCRACGTCAPLARTTRARLPTTRPLPLTRSCAAQVCGGVWLGLGGRCGVG